jgi:hypothetical protein
MHITTNAILLMPTYTRRSSFCQWGRESIFFISQWSNKLYILGVIISTAKMRQFCHLFAVHYLYQQKLEETFTGARQHGDIMVWWFWQCLHVICGQALPSPFDYEVDA